MADVALSAEEIQARMIDIPGWDHRDGQLQRAFEFANFSEAFGFMARVALLAEKLDEPLVFLFAMLDRQPGPSRELHVEDVLNGATFAQKFPVRKRRDRRSRVETVTALQ